jgi:hypothetical protein
MTYSLLAARAAIGSAALALAALAALHLLKPEIHPARTMISQYALGRFGWVMAVCFAAFGAASASLFAALVPYAPSWPTRIGLALLLTASIGFAMAARYPMDPVSTPPSQMSFTGRMHGVAFLLGVPSMVLAVLILSLVLVRLGSHPPLPLMTITAVVWLSLVTMIAIMLMVGPGKPPDPNGPERFIGWPNRMLMVGYAAWLMLAAWPMARF